MAEVDGEIVGSDHRRRANRMAADQGGMGSIVDHCVAQIPIAIRKGQIEFRNHRAHFESRLA